MEILATLPPETIQIDLADFHAGAVAYYAVLAYPIRSELQRRQDFFRAMAARQIKEFAQLIPGSRRDIPTYWTRFKNEKIGGTMRRGWTRLVRRIQAGVAGWCVVLNHKPFLFDEPLPTGQVGFILRGPNTVNQVMGALVGNVPGDPKEAVANAVHRVWAESLPVLHLAMRNPVTTKIVEEHVNGGEKSISHQINKALFDSTYEPTWLPDSLAQAEELRLKLPELLGTRPDDVLGRGFRAERATRVIPR